MQSTDYYKDINSWHWVKIFLQSAKNEKALSMIKEEFGGAITNKFEFLHPKNVLLSNALDEEEKGG